MYKLPHASFRVLDSFAMIPAVEKILVNGVWVVVQCEPLEPGLLLTVQRPLSLACLHQLPLREAPSP